MWAEQRLTGGYRVMARGPAGTRELARGSGREELTLAASGDRVAVLTAREVRAGTLTSPFRRLADCTSAAVCTGATRGVAVAEDAIAFQWARGGRLGVDVVSFLPDGTTTTRTFAGATGLFALAGRFLAAGNADQTTLDVSDRLTGEPVYSVARGGGLFDVQEDGTVVFQASRTELAYASVREPSAHPLGFGGAGPGARSDAATLIAGNRVVISDGRRFAVETLTGAIRDSPRVAGLRGGFDFDGRRLAFAVKPCLVTSVVTWDVDGGPFPTTPRGPCPAARPSIAGRRVARGGRVAVRLRCPGDPLLGCPGFVDLGGGATRFYDLRPGGATTLHVPLDADQRRRLRGRGTLTVTITSAGTSSAVGNEREVRRVRLRRP